jgi:phenylpropionate dioxygenase-like ring-hydroxylating dioxygenase large terminal subunit
MFLRDFWYVAAFGHEVTRKPRGRTILGEPIVFFRKENGEPVALEDRCVHRHLPLSMGKLVGDHLQCHYHGLRYDSTGQCVSVPGQNTIPPGARVRAYPVVERYKWLWAFMGDPSRADPAAIPDFHWLDDKAWGAKGSYLHVKANWQLIVDNLLDLTHLAFVHESTIGNAALVENAAVKVTRTADSVVVTRWIIDAPAPRPSSRRVASPRRSTDGRSLISRRPLICALMSGQPQPGPAPRRAGAPAAYRCAISTRSRLKPRPQAIISGARRMTSMSATRN